MTPLEVVREIIADCERDAAKLDTRPFDARNCAEVFGETLATLQALAKVVEGLLEHRHDAHPARGDMTGPPSIDAKETR